MGCMLKRPNNPVTRQEMERARRRRYEARLRERVMCVTVPVNEAVLDRLVNYIWVTKWEAEAADRDAIARGIVNAIMSLPLNPKEH